MSSQTVCINGYIVDELDRLVVINDLHKITVFIYLISVSGIW